nr:MAG TPA_asm: hypothetical protein [Caudoviricetes sp.]
MYIIATPFFISSIYTKQWYNYRLLLSRTN